MFCVLIGYVMPGYFALSCPKNVSAQSDPVLFSVHLTIKYLNLNCINPHIVQAQFKASL